MVDEKERPKRPDAAKLNEDQWIHVVFTGGKYNESFSRLGVSPQQGEQMIINHYKNAYSTFSVETLFAGKDQDSVDLRSAWEKSFTVMRQVWVRDRFFYKSMKWMSHFIDKSSDHPGLLTYFQSDEKRAAGIRTPIKPGRYLTKYFSDILDEETIRLMAIDFTEWATPPKVHITQDADEIEKLYLRGPNSCMSKTINHFKSSVHPVRVYAGPDLAIAYLGDLEKPEARAVVWPEKQIFGRRYGDIERITIALQAINYKEGSFEGARLQRVWSEEYEAFVAPYIDNATALFDNGEFLVIDRRKGDLPAQKTSGFAHSHPSRRIPCAVCDVRKPEHSLKHYYAEDMMVCDECYPILFFTCDYTGSGFCEWKDMRPGFDGEKYSARLSDLYLCEGSGLYVPDDEDVTRFRRVLMANGQTWSRIFFRKNGFTDSIDGKKYPNSERVDISMVDGIGDMKIPISRASYAANPEAAMKLIEDLKSTPMFTVGQGTDWGELRGLTLPGVTSDDEGYVGLLIPDEFLSIGTHDLNGAAPDGNGIWFNPYEVEPVNYRAHEIHATALRNY